MKSISDRDVIFHRRIGNIEDINFDHNKPKKKRPKNRAPITEVELTRRSTLSIRAFLREFCVQLLENCYNPLMYAVKVCPQPIATTHSCTPSRYVHNPLLQPTHVRHQGTSTTHCYNPLMYAVKVCPQPIATTHSCTPSRYVHNPLLQPTHVRRQGTSTTHCYNPLMYAVKVRPQPIATTHSCTPSRYVHNPLLQPTHVRPQGTSTNQWLLW